MKTMRLYLLFSTSLVLVFANLFNISAEAPKRAKIVFTSTRNANAEIYIMNADGSEEIRLTHHPGDDFDPTWSPNGEHIAFVSERDHKGLYDIYLMDANGKNIRRAFNDLDYRTAPAWSPDGKHIAYHTYSPEPDWAVYTNTLGGGEAERVAESGIYPGGFPAWSPDGTEIAFVSGNPTEWRIRVINLKTREQETFLPKTLGSHIHYPAWSPDGKHIAFALRKWGAGAKPGIYIIRRDGKKCEEIVENAFGIPAWSPDGKELLYRKTIGDAKLLFKINLNSHIETELARLGPTIRHGQNIGWDWFDPKVLPVAPQPQLLTTVWGQMKTQD